MYTGQGLCSLMAATTLLSTCQAEVDILGGNSFEEQLDGLPENLTMLRQVAADSDIELCTLADGRKS